MAQGTGIGEVTLNTAKIATRDEGGQFLLFHVPSGRFLALEGDGRRVWESIVKGTRDIATLIKEHAEAACLAPEVASFQIISFLDELRAQQFLDYRLAREKDSAPQIDVPLGSTSSGDDSTRTGVKTPGPSSTGEKRVIMLEPSRTDLTLRDLKQLAERTIDFDLPPIEKVILADVPRDQLSIPTMRRIAAGAEEDPSDSIRRMVTFDGPASDMTVKELHGIAGMNPRLAAASAVRRVIVIVIIVDGVIIVVIGSDPGTSYGKSRSACKTVCV
ncbi:hypothetical protein P12x_000466 [Tundrisphaera lichenicola]|uniref:hypothetical protein n=1 Tax=Tundrisphaera lichenicola TaxID=2029860 RepID=UPI003EBDC76D